MRDAVGGQIERIQRDNAKGRGDVPPWVYIAMFAGFMIALWLAPYL